MRYTPEEDALIDAHYPDVALLLKEMPHRTKDAIRARARALGITRPILKSWTIKEIAVVRANSGDLKRAHRLLPHRTFNAIKSMSTDITVVRHKKWSDVEDDLIRKLSAHHSDRQISKFLGCRSPTAVTARRELLGLKKPNVRSSRVLSPVVADVKSEAKRRRVKLRTLTNAMNLAPLSNGRKKFSHPTLFAVVTALRGELYAEWLE